ncbi:MAG: hypothetical protein H7321_07555 [Bacteroidia bacterium]|nr:hypothetical protein [Bacteroidia bacterium]
MSRVRLLSIVAIGLLLANILLVSYIVFRKPGRPPHESPKEIIIERLHFSNTQVNEYNKLISWHRSEIDKSDFDMMHLKDQLYHCLSSNENSTKKDSVLTEIGKLQMRIEQIHYKHFEDLKKICTVEQLPNFENLLNDMSHIFSKPKGEPRK